MARVNLNDIAKYVTEIEGKRKIQNIGDVKEILKIVFTRIDLVTIIKIWMKFNKQ